MTILSIKAFSLSSASGTPTGRPTGSPSGRPTGSPTGRSPGRPTGRPEALLVDPLVDLVALLVDLKPYW